MDNNDYMIPCIDCGKPVEVYASEDEEPYVVCDDCWNIREEREVLRALMNYVKVHVPALLPYVKDATVKIGRNEHGTPMEAFITMVDDDDNKSRFHFDFSDDRIVMVR